MKVKEILAEIEPLGTDSYKRVMMKHGVKEPFFGVKISDLQKIVKRIKKDYQLALDLYETGWGRVGKLRVTPTQEFVAYQPVGNIPHPADWIPTGSLRNAEDFFNLFPKLGEANGPSMPWTIARWFKEAGYTQSEWGELGSSPLYVRKLRMERLSYMVRLGWRVALLINHELEGKTPAFSSRLYPDHYVGMVAPAVFTPAGDWFDLGDDLMGLTIFSHRLEYDVGANYKGWVEQTGAPLRRPKPLTTAEVMRYIWSYSAGRY